MKFTDKYILNLKPKAKMYQIREGEGFGIRILPSGHKIWIYTYTFDGYRRQMNLGSYPDKSLADAKTAYKAAFAMLNDPSNPRDPQAERDQQQTTARQAREEHRKALTIPMLVDKYVKSAMEKKTSWKEEQRILNKDVVSVWGKRKAKDITRRDVLDFLEGMKGRGDGITTNTFKIIRQMFRYAVKQGIVPATPCYEFDKGEELPRPVSKERTLSVSEIKTFWTGLDNAAISKEIQRIMKLILVTGQRPVEVCSMHTSEINDRWWEFTPKETKITKGIPRKQRIYLTDTALELIGETNGKGYLFPAAVIKTDVEGNIIDDHITVRAVSHALRRNLLSHEVKSKPATWKKARTKPQRKNPFVIPDDKKMDVEKFTPHDLRRTCATMLSQIGFSDEVVDAVLAHLKKGTIKAYNQNKYDKEKQTALEAWERKLRNTVTEGKNKGVIISISAKTR